MGSVTTYERTIADQRVRIEELEETVRQLTDRLNAYEIQFPLSWGMAPSEAKALRSLYTSANGFRSREALRIAIANSDNTTDKVVDVAICKLRKSVEPHGLKIDTRFAEGYQLTAESRVKLAEIVAQCAPGAASQ